MDKTFSAERILTETSIRPLAVGDLNALEWDGEFKHFRLIYMNTFRRCLEGKALAWVAIHPTRGLIGQVFVQLECDRPELADGSERAYMFSFRIKPDFRCLGLGTRMIEILEKEIASRGFKIVTLNVARENSGALRLYGRCGYIVVAADPGRWSFPDENGNWHEVEEPSWRMEKEI
jgi:GNAT superfamily N-acetyltransferase